MNYRKRCSIIHSIAEKFQELEKTLGKTATMKFMYLLQRVYKVPLGYEFSIYTYGPYSAEVMCDMDSAENIELVKVEFLQPGYSITPLNEENKEPIEDYEEYIAQMLNVFGNKTPGELELLTTIVYLYNNYHRNQWHGDLNIETISNDVAEIKPHFEISEIKQAYMELENNNIFNMAIE